MFKDYLNCIMTQGFKAFCEQNKSYWLFSDIAVILMDRKIREQEDFILIHLVVIDNKAHLKLYSDYSKEDIEFNKQHELYSQNYEYTDLKKGTYQFYACKNELNTYTFMLKEEY